MKMLAVCALAGDNTSSRTLAVLDVQKAVISGIAHKDFSIFNDTVKALDGNKRMIASVIRASLARLDDTLRNMRGGFSAFGDHVPAFHGFTVADLTVAGKKPAALLDAITVWASGVAEAWLQGVDADLAAATAAAKEKRAAAKAAKEAATATETPAQETPATVTETPATATARAVGKAVAVTALEGERKRTAARLRSLRKANRDLRLQVLLLQQQIAAAQAAAAAKPKRQAAKKAA